MMSERLYEGNARSRPVFKNVTSFPECFIAPGLDIDPIWIACITHHIGGEVFLPSCTIFIQHFKSKLGNYIVMIIILPTIKYIKLSDQGHIEERIIIIIHLI